jgi:hypothetical protein
MGHGDDLTQIYEAIFRRLRRHGLDWVYHFPRIYFVDFRHLREAMDPERKPDRADYSPSAALANEVADQEREKEITARCLLSEATRPPLGRSRAKQSVTLCR